MILKDRNFEFLRILEPVIYLFLSEEEIMSFTELVGLCVELPWNSFYSLERVILKLGVHFETHWWFCDCVGYVGVLGICWSNGEMK